MPSLEQQIPEYLDQTLGVRPTVVAWGGANRLPAFLTARYRFMLMDLDGGRVLLVLDERAEPESPGTVRTHVEQVRAKWDGPMVYVRSHVPAYNRKRLIEQRVPFIVPGRQMYLPELGLDLRERARTPRPSPSRRALRPATQAVLIFLLLERDGDGTATTATTLAPSLGYSAMTLSRAFDELEAAGLATTSSSGRERVLRFREDRRQTWERARPWLIDPVKSRHFVTIDPAGLKAGQDALARLTMLAEPRLPVTAIGHRAWLAFRRERPEAEVPDRDSARCEIEVWKYPPREHDRPGVVEPLSLLLSLEQTADERVEQALDTLVEQVRW